MKRIAIVVQRCHKKIVGGSEALAWQYANLLSNQFQVDILTTTALDYVSWANELVPGIEVVQGINIHRFPVTIGRSNYWHNLHAQLVREFQYSESSQTQPKSCRQIPWTIALQEEYIRHQGPYSEALISFLRNQWKNYETIIFTTYLYPTTYFGLAQIPPSRALLAPTLHDEPTAYLSAYKHMAHKAHSLIWLTNAEKNLSQELWGDLQGSTVCMGVETALRKPYVSKKQYILYCGRIDPSKGCSNLLDFFIRFKNEHSSSLRLVLTGKSEMKIPSRPDIEFRGFVSAEEKFQLMAGASIFVMPSSYESFSIVTLEAMAQRTPVLVNGSCQVLADHVIHSQGGMIYKSYEDFSHAIQELLINQDKTDASSNLARDYVVSNYAFDSIQKKLVDAIEERSKILI